MAIEIRITMMLTTTMISTKVKPRRRFNLPRQFHLPLGVLSSIACLFSCFAVNVKDALAAPTRGLGVVLIAAHSPFGFAGERVHRNSPQKAHFLAVGPGQLHAFHKDRSEEHTSELKSHSEI